METPKHRSIKKSAAVVNYLRSIFDFGFIMFMIPYRVIWTQKGYTVYTNSVHKVICTLLQLLILFETISWLFLAFRNSLTHTAFHYLVLAHVTGCLIYRLIYIRIFWFKRKSFIQLLDQLENLEFLSNSDAVSRIVQMKAYGLMIWTICFAFTELAAVNLGLVHEGFMGGNFNNIRTTAKALYLYEEMSTNSTISNIILKEPQSGTSVLGVVVTSIHFIGILPHYVCISTLDKNVLVLALLGRHLVLDFLTFSKQHEANKTEVFRQYQALKDVVTAINDSFGVLPLVLVIGCLPFYPTWTGVVILQQTQNWYQIVQFLIFFGTFFLLLGIAAEMNSKIGEFYKMISSQTLLSDYPPEIGSDKLTAISMDMISEQVALSGGRFFKMTYGFLGTILSVIVTYTMIITQFQFSRE